MTAQVSNLVLSVTGFTQFSVVLGHAQVGKDEVIVVGPADAHPAGRQRQHRGGPPVDAEAIVVRNLRRGRASRGAGSAGGAAPAVRRSGRGPRTARRRRGGWAARALAPGSRRRGRALGGRGEPGRGAIITHRRLLVTLCGPDLGRYRLVDAGRGRVPPGRRRGIEGTSGVVTGRAGRGGQHRGQGRGRGPRDL